MTTGPWLRLLARNRFAVSPGRLPMALAVGCLSVINSTAGLLQRARYGRVIGEAVIDPPPLFIVGHWRTGTTLKPASGRATPAAAGTPSTRPATRPVEGPRRAGRAPEGPPVR